MAQISEFQGSQLDLQTWFALAVSKAISIATSVTDFSLWHRHWQSGGHAEFSFQSFALTLNYNAIKSKVDGHSSKYTVMNQAGRSMKVELIQFNWTAETAEIDDNDWNDVWKRYVLQQRTVLTLKWPSTLTHRSTVSENPGPWSKDLGSSMTYLAVPFSSFPSSLSSLTSSTWTFHAFLKCQTFYKIGQFVAKSGPDGLDEQLVWSERS